MQIYKNYFFYGFIKVGFVSIAVINFLLPIQAQNSEKVPYIMVLGVAQDAGYPQMGCGKDCCQAVYNGTTEEKMVASLALINPTTNNFWLFDATPDIAKQIQKVNTHLSLPAGNMPSALFLTHAHIGHYTGLMYFGREVMGANRQKVYGMERMCQFLRSNGPWSQLVLLENIALLEIREGEALELEEGLFVRALRVPHRDEFSEIVGYVISSLTKKILFIPDIDKWDQDIIKWIKKVDVAYIDGTFYKDGEIAGRDMSEIPHPFIAESIALFQKLSEKEKRKVKFPSESY